jgi:hypothetical protein
MLKKTRHWTIQSLHAAAQVEVKFVRATRHRDTEGFFIIIECNSGLCLKILRAFQREFVG